MRFDKFVEINPKVNIDKGVEYPFVEMADVIPTRRYVQANNSREFGGGGSKFRAGDTLFARITPCLENGKIAQFVDKEYQFGFGSTEFIVFRARAGISDPSFVYYLARTNTIRGPAEKSMSGASGRQRADAEVIRRIEVDVPTLDVQQKIACILSTYDDLTENNLRRIKILEEMAQTIYQEWFVKFRFPGHQMLKMVDSPLGKTPEGWEIKNLFELADLTYGFPFKSPLFNTNREGRPVVRIRDVLNGQSTTFTTEDAPDKYIVHDGDFLVGMDGDFHMGFWAGGTALLVQRVARFRPRGDVGRYALSLALKEPIERFNKMITGTTVAHLGDKHLRTINMIMPDKKLLKELNDILEPLLDLQLNLRAKNRNLCQTRDLLLPKLISGELDVSDLDITIPEVNA
jgi:type I restriction enzyme S subunit